MNMRHDMKKLDCAVSGGPTWGNLSLKNSYNLGKPGERRVYRCTKCGSVSHNVSKA